MFFVFFTLLQTAHLVYGQQQFQQTTTNLPQFQQTTNQQQFQQTSDQQEFQQTSDQQEFQQTTDQQQFQSTNFPVNQVTINPGPAEIPQADANGIVAETYRLRIQLPVSDENGSEHPMFLGSLTMDIRVTNETQTVILYALHLNISGNTVSMQDQDGGAIAISNVITDLTAQVVVLQTNQSLTPGRLYTISFSRFGGRINVGGDSGVFASYVQDSPGGDQIYAMVTQFQTNGARLVFPCLDTPKTKATLSLTIVHPTGTIAIGNMEVQQTRLLDANWNEAVFATTPQLSAYLMAFAVLPDLYEVVEQVSPATDIVVRVRFNPREIYDPENLLAYALFTLDALNTKFQEQLPIRKLDLLIVPNFNGGMENFGMITLSQEFMKEESEVMKLYIIAHEIAHQWVGDLTTIGTWSELCLQEDLTDWYAFKVVDLYTGTRSDDANQSHDQNNSTQWFQFQLTNYLEVQTVENLIAPGESLLMLDNPDIEQVGSRCYLKGVTLFQALERLIGTDAFEAKIRDFLSKYKFRSYRMSDFLLVFSDKFVDDKTSVAQVFDFWYKNGGFPVLLAQRDYNMKQLRLTQANMGKLAQMGTATWRTMPLWPLPITIKTELGDAPSPVRVMISAGLSIGPLPVERQQYVLVNSDFAGFYRVNYDRTNWELLQQAMQDNPNQFSPLTRAQLINDFCYFNAQGMVQNGEPLRQAFVKMVYNQPTKYDLCHWYMGACSESPVVLASEPRDEAKSVITGLMKQFNGLFTMYGNKSDYSCQTQAVQIGNRICQLFFGAIPKLLQTLK